MKTATAARWLLMFGINGGEEGDSNIAVFGCAWLIHERFRVRLPMLADGARTKRDLTVN
jgi:hypothetical protein